MSHATNAPLKWTEALLIEKLRNHHPQGRWLFLPGVLNGTGFQWNRQADAVAIALYRPQDYRIVGYEIKVSRSDWQREMQQAEKAEETYGYCDYMVVCAAPGCVRLDELPSFWGLLEPTRRGLTYRKPPVRREANIPRSVLASLLQRSFAEGRRPHEMERNNEIRVAVERETRHLQESLDAANAKIERVREFTYELGVDPLYRPSWEPHAHEIRAAMDGLQMPEESEKKLRYWLNEVMLIEKSVKNLRERLVRATRDDACRATSDDGVAHHGH